MMIISETHKTNNCFTNYNVDKGYLKLLLDSNDAEDHVDLSLIIEDLIKQPRCCVLKFLCFEELKARILNNREEKLKPEMVESILGAISIVNKYLNKSSVNAQCFFGNEDYQNVFTPLHLAVMNNEYEAIYIVKLLLFCNAHVNAKYFLDQTPLHIASRIKLDAQLICNEPDIMDALLLRNGDVNAKDSLGNTPLFNVLPHHLKDSESSFNMCFTHNSHLLKAARKFELLMAYEPNLAMIKNEGENTLNYIAGNLCYSSYSALNSVDRYYASKASSQHFTLVDLLKEIFGSNLKFNVNQRDNTGYTPLQIALLSMNADVFEILLKMVQI